LVKEKDTKLAAQEQRISDLETRLAELESHANSTTIPAQSTYTWLLLMVFGLLGVTVGLLITRRAQKGAVQ
jgi:hypothetical protein